MTTQPAVRPRRSVLYMPGSNARALEKAKSIPADALILDLEDAVAPDAKDAARQHVCEAVRSGSYGRRELVIRINGEAAPWFDADIAAAISAAPHAILIPKLEQPAQLQRIAERLQRAPAARETRIWGMLETPLAILNAASIAECAAKFPETRLDVLVIGTNDLAKETRALQEPGRAAFVPWLMTCVAAARAYRLEILDGAFNNFRDLDGLRL